MAFQTRYGLSAGAPAQPGPGQAPDNQQEQQTQQQKDDAASKTTQAEPNKPSA